MKKLICLLIGLLLLSGCGKGDNYSTFMIKDHFDAYNLYDHTGDLLTKLRFKSYQENYKNGYLVTNDKDQQAYINYEGDMIVDYGEYDKLSFSDGMVIGTKVKEEKKGEQTVKTNVYYIMDNDGKVLYVSNSDVKININVLPVVSKDGLQYVLHKNGETLFAESIDILYTLHDSENSIYVVATPTFVDVFYYVNDEKKVVNVPVTGNYVISDIDNMGILMYDSSLKNVVYVNLNDGTSKVFNNITASHLYFDDSKNIVFENNYSLYLLGADSNQPKLMNTYYKDFGTYVNRSQDVYGPHGVYLEKKLITSLKDCQIFPSAYQLQGNYYPVYVKDGGYQYYGFDGKQPFTTSYYDAEPFDKNGRAIVRDSSSACYLINESGLSVSKTYFDIKFISSSYYAAYNKDGNFGIIDIDGNVILPMGYTTLPENNIFHYDGMEYIMVEKYGRTYVYNASKEYKEVFSVEGNTVFSEKGYFLVDEMVYYTLDGEMIK